MQGFILLIKMLDLFIDISMKVYGIYLFFFKQDHWNGSIIFGMSGIYSLSMAAGIYLQRSPSPKKVEYI